MPQQELKMILNKPWKAKFVMILKFMAVFTVFCLVYHMWIMQSSSKRRVPEKYNITELTYSIKSNVCSGIKPYLIVIVPSHPLHAAARLVLRKAYNQNFKQGLTKVVFMFGNVTNPELQEMIEKESNQHGDIIQGNFLDSYKSISMLHLSGIKWVVMYCPQALYVMESDDDIFVNIKQMLANVHLLGNGTFMYCDPIYDAAPPRNADNKYCITEEEYSGSYYPTYCNGWSVVYPTHVAKKLIDVVSTVPFLWMSDVFITGILAHKIESLEYITMRPNYTWHVEDLKAWMKEGSKDFDRYLVGPTWGDNNLLKRLHKMVGNIR